MATPLIFTVLDVGQGTGNFIEIRDPTNTKITAALLIDLGSEGGRIVAGKPSAAYVVDRLESMDAPKLTAVFLSHSDSDHINLLIDVLSKFAPPGTVDPTKKNLTIDKVYYGGAKQNYIKHGTNYLTELGKYCTSLNPVEDDASSFKAGITPPVPFASAGELTVYLLIGNTIAENIELRKGITRKRKLSEAFAINTRSLVLLLTYHNFRLIVMGDATGLTLAKCNEYVKKAELAAFSKGPFDLTLPHHGSDTSTYDICGTTADGLDTNELAQAVVDEFVKAVQPKTISASAGERHSFRHPSFRVITDFSKHLTSDIYYEDKALKNQNEDTHFFTAHFPGKKLVLDGATVNTWPSIGGWQTIRSNQNVFSTDYYNVGKTDGILWEPPSNGVLKKELKPLNPEPPAGMGWHFEFNGNARPKITGRERPETLLLAPAAATSPAAGVNPVPVSTRPILLAPARAACHRPVERFISTRLRNLTLVP